MDQDIPKQTEDNAQRKPYIERRHLEDRIIYHFEFDSVVVRFDLCLN